MTNNRQCSVVTIPFTYTNVLCNSVYMTQCQWCYGLKCLGLCLALGYILTIPRCVAVAIPKVQTVVSS